MRMRLHAMEPLSRANGPGTRAAIWFQGCTLGCPGCFNPLTHSTGEGVEADTADIADQILEHRENIDGVSFSGGEPFQQPEALLDLLKRIKPARLSTLVFTGYTLNEVIQMPLGGAVLCRLDVLIAGRYVQARHDGRGLIGSSNQQIHLLSKRYTLGDFTDIPKAEIIIHIDGTISLTGIAPASKSNTVLDAHGAEHGDTSRRTTR